MNKDFVEQFLTSGALVKIANGRILVGWGKCERTNQPAPNNYASFYFPDFFLKDLQPWFAYENVKEFALEELLSLIAHRPSSSSSSPHPLHWETTDKELFSKTFQDLQVKFKAGTLAKAVPFIFEKAAAKIDKILLKQMLQTLLQKAQTLPIYPYGIWDLHEGMLGGTPEVLFNTDGTKLHTAAVAGTAPVDHADHLLQDSKELHEHELVVKGIASSLNAFGKVTPGKCCVLTLPTLAHLVTPITVDIAKSIPFINIVEAIHPTPALGAFPKAAGAVWLKSYQTKINRKRFGAPAGYYIPSKNEGGCYVAIRNVQWDNLEMKIGAGCGVVPQSILEKEWTEIQLKIKSIKGLLHL